MATFQHARRVRSAVALAVAALAVSGASASSAPAPKLIAPHPCPRATGFTCSTLVVPLDHDGQRPGALKLQVAAAANDMAPRGVLLFLTGGPGQPGVPAAPKLAKVLGGALSDYRLVVYDQRGTGSGALECPALQQAMGFSDLYPPSPGAVRECARALGADRHLYGTDDVVNDMELLRRALGVDRWTLDGVSYGTFVAERYAVAHPEHVHRLVLDSVVPHRAGYDLLAAELRAAARVLRLVCRETRCPGDPAGDLASVVRRYDNGPELLDALTLLSIVDPTFRRQFDVPGVLHAARRGKTAPLTAFLRTIRRWERAPARALSQGLHASALCADWRFPWGDASAPIAGRAERLAAAAARLTTRELWPFDRATAVRNGFQQQCLHWLPSEPTPPAAAARLPNLPVLFVVGDRDLSTPLEWARREAALAPAGRLFVVRGAGHSVQARARSDLGRDTVVAFLTH
jgi:pimeloyl-ACP methyl ester carboxylesterase